MVPATEADRAFFVQVHHAAYRATIEQMFGWDEVLQDEFANKAFDGGSIHIIWFDYQKVGVVGWEELPDFFWLKELFLLPNYQRKGIGSKLLTLLIDQAQVLGKLVRLQTLRANLDAKKLYERHGFSVEDATDLHWRMIRRPTQTYQARSAKF